MESLIGLFIAIVLLSSLCFLFIDNSPTTDVTTPRPMEKE